MTEQEIIFIIDTLILSAERFMINTGTLNTLINRQHPTTKKMDSICVIHIKHLKIRIFLFSLLYQSIFDIRNNKCYSLKIHKIIKVLHFGLEIVKGCYSLADYSADSKWGLTVPPPTQSRTTSSVLICRTISWKITILSNVSQNLLP